MNLRRLSLKNLQDREYLSGRFIGFTEWGAVPNLSSKADLRHRRFDL